MGRKKRQEKKKEYLTLVPLFLILVLLVFFNVNIYRQREITKERLFQAKEEFQKISQEEELFPTQEMTEEEVEEKIESIAREQLLLRKEGEEVVVISREEEEEEEEEEKEEEVQGFFERVMEIFKTE